MKYTTNLRLKKPDLTDPVDVTILNDNANTLDNAVSNALQGVELNGNNITTLNAKTAANTENIAKKRNIADSYNKTEINEALAAKENAENKSDETITAENKSADKYPTTNAVHNTLTSALAIKANKDDITTLVNNGNTELLAALGGTLGLNLTQVAAGDGKVYYLHNAAALSNSKVVMKLSAGGVLWTTNYTGADSTTAWESAIGSNGQAFFPNLSTYEISANKIKGGVLTSLDGVSASFDLANGTITVGTGVNKTVIGPAGTTLATPVKIYGNDNGQQLPANTALSYGKQRIVLPIVGAKELIVGKVFDATGLAGVIIGNENTPVYAAGGIVADTVTARTVNAVALQADTLYVNAQQVVDYIINQGSANNWRYREYAGGRKEAEYYKDISPVAVTDAVGGFYQSAQITVNYPAIFTATTGTLPVVHIELYGNIDIGTLGDVHVGRIIPGYKSVGFRIVSNVSATHNNVKIGIRLVSM